MYTGRDAWQFKGVPMKDRPLSYQLQAEIDLLPQELQDSLLDYIDRIIQMEDKLTELREDILQVSAGADSFQKDDLLRKIKEIAYLVI